MSWFSKTATETIPAPAPPIDREAALLEQLRTIDAQLDSLNREMLQFRTRHSLRTDKFSRIVGARGSSVTGFAAIQREWQALVKKSDALFFARNDVLQAWSAAKAGK